MNTEHNSTSSSNSANNSVDRILNALRDATPPPGMEHRVLNILEAQSSLKTVLPSEHRKHLPGVSFRARRSRAEESPHFARTATALRWTAGTVLAALTIALITFNTHRQTSPASVTKAPPTPTLVPQTPIATASESAPVHHIKASSHQAKPRLLETTQTAEDAQISHPAPPIPLTEQDRLLLRYARRGRTEDLAQINNESKAAKEQQDAAEFQAFFKPPITIGESE